MTAAYVEDTDRLGLGRPDSEPKASETIEAIVALIEDLVESGHAYEAGGDVYFSVRASPATASSRTARSRRCARARATTPPRSSARPQDFALWKATKEGEDTSWSSPWGEGRPGWHIECSAMAEELLGVDFEVHGGGSDLVFPHHENEIAQTEAARGRPLARVWMHNGMVEMGAEKMAKSVGNIRLLHGALDEFGPEAILMWLVSAHYRKPIGYSEEALDQAEANVRTIRELVRRLDAEAGRRGISTTWPSASSTPWPTTSTPQRPAPSSSSGWPEANRRLDARRARRAGAPARDAPRVRARAARGPGGRGGPRGRSRAGRPARGGSRGARLRRGGPAARRACGTGLGGPRHRRTAPASSALE